MRTLDAQQTKMFRVRGTQHKVRVKIEDGSATLQDWTNLFGDDYVVSVTWGESLDEPVMSGTLELHWKKFERNASPFVSGTQLDDFLDVWRKITIEVAIFPLGDEVQESDYQLMVIGRIDDVDISSQPAQVTFRELIGAELMDLEFIQLIRRYGDDEGAEDIEDVITDILTDSTLGHTLTTPVPTGFEIKEYRQQKMPVLEAVQRLAQFTIGWICRSEFNEGAQDFELTLSEPDRTSPSVDFTFQGKDYQSFPSWDHSIENIRNCVRVVFGAKASQDNLGNDTRTFEDDEDATSVSAYGKRYMEMAEASSSLIQTPGEAATLVAAALADLAEPTLRFGIALRMLFWPVELNDYFTLEPDGIRFDANITISILSYMHNITAEAATTVFQVQKLPSAGRETWLRREARPGQNENFDDLAPAAPVLAGVAKMLAAGIGVTFPSEDQDWDIVEIHSGSSAGFTPSSSTLVTVGRTSDYDFADLVPDEAVFFKALFRDVTGNISAISNTVSVTPDFVEDIDLDPELREFIHVILSANQLEVEDDELVFFDEELEDPLNHFNDLLGEFEAGVDGVYAVECLIELVEHTNVEFFRPKLMLNAETTDTEVATGPDGTPASPISTLSTTINLDSGDRLEIRMALDPLNAGMDPVMDVSAVRSYFKIVRLPSNIGRT